MSNQWHGGKGDKNRTKDKDQYANNFDNIFRKSNENKADLLEERMLDMSSDLMDQAKKMLDEVLNDVKEVEETPPLGLHVQRPTMDSKGNYSVEWVGCNNFGKAGEFMNVFGQETLTRPTLPNSDLAGLRLDLIQEEVDELREGLANQDIVEIADALTDILYVVYGAGHAFGIDLDKCYQEVHRSNMTKLDADGKPLFREDGKVMKSDSYEPPNLTKIILGDINDAV
jgi:predicted HAD superfamily Cof-like phosphohydrolase